MTSELAIAEWDVTIERALTGGHTEQKLIRTVSLLTAAVQRSRLRGDSEALVALSDRLAHVRALLDQV